jgi:hypothetical protein
MTLQDCRLESVCRTSVPSAEVAVYLTGSVTDRDVEKKLQLYHPRDDSAGLSILYVPPRASAQMTEQADA